MLMLSCAAARGAGGGFPHESDHTLILQIETVPPKATVSALPDGGGEPLTLGETPYVAVIECTWATRLLVKQWSKLKLWSPGDIARSAYDPEDKSHTLHARFLVAMPGYISQTVDTYVAVFPYVADWDGIRYLPRRETVTVNLEKKNPEPGATATPATAIRTVIIAAGQTSLGDDFGTLEITCDVPGAFVTVDREDPVATPVRLVMRAGEHALSVGAPGYSPFERTITVEPGEARSLRVRLQPGAE